MLPNTSQDLGTGYTLGNSLPVVDVVKITMQELRERQRG